MAVEKTSQNDAVQEAWKEKGGLEKILLCIDNSDTSGLVAESVLGLARLFGSEVVGMHAYNAFMHEGAFRIMEPTLPEQYQKEEVLIKQREVHTSLINVGLEKISLSYLSPYEDMFWKENINFRCRVKEGKNYRGLLDLAAEEGGDLLALGDKGFSEELPGFMGSVCARVLRGFDGDLLVVKKPVGRAAAPRYVVCLDGSPAALRAFRAAVLLAERVGAELHLIYVFDSNLHREIFQKMKDSLIINGDGFSFNSKEQEKLHDLFIDKGLLRVGEMILSRAVKEVLNGSSAVPQRSIKEGTPFKEICDYASSVGADLIFLGKTGRHYAPGMDIGSTAENVVRFAPCSVWMTRHEEHKGWML